MPIIKLTEAAWLKREADKLEGHLIAQLPKEGVEQSVIVHLLKDLGTEYTTAELIQIRDELVVRGTIEVV